MIRVQVTLGRDGLALSAVGHAGYAPRGQDVVCAGVSALLYGFVAYLEGLSSIATAGAFLQDGGAPHLEVSEGDGELRVRTRGLGRRDIQGFGVTEAGLRLIAACYPTLVTLDVYADKKGDEHEPN
ncbi:MAG: ribosomal-processing cysteine protease Prp [Clostridia bacterium]|nr:ribosomal-processing cysteine protease Prp [Clostridia bacterium]